MAILHLIAHPTLPADFWQRVAPCDAVLLIENAVSLPVIHQQKIATCGAKLYVLQSDVTARGLGAIPPAIAVDYAGFVELVVEYNQTIRW